jgi:hypothetical protein
VLNRRLLLFSRARATPVALVARKECTSLNAQIHFLLFKAIGGVVVFRTILLLVFRGVVSAGYLAGALSCLFATLVRVLAAAASQRPPINLELHYGSLAGVVDAPVCPSNEGLAPLPSAQAAPVAAPSAPSGAAGPVVQNVAADAVPAPVAPVAPPGTTGTRYFGLTKYYSGPYNSAKDYADNSGFPNFIPTGNPAPFVPTPLVFPPINDFWLAEEDDLFDL